VLTFEELEKLFKKFLDVEGVWGRLSKVIAYSGGAEPLGVLPLNDIFLINITMITIYIIAIGVIIYYVTPMIFENADENEDDYAGKVLTTRKPWSK